MRELSVGYRLFAVIIGHNHPQVIAFEVETTRSCPIALLPQAR